MEYPKPIMTIPELYKMGFPRDYLERAAHCKHADKFASRTSRRGKWLFDTQEFEKLRKKGCFL